MKCSIVMLGDNFASCRLVMGMIVRGPKAIRYPCSRALVSLGWVAGEVISRIVWGGNNKSLRKLTLLPPTNKAKEFVPLLASLLLPSRSVLLMIETPWNPCKISSHLTKGTLVATSSLKQKGSVGTYSLIGGKGFFFVGLAEALRVVLGCFLVLGSTVFLGVLSHEVVLLVLMLFHPFHLLELACVGGKGVKSGSVLVGTLRGSFFIQGSCLVQGSGVSSVIPNLKAWGWPW